MAGEYQFSLIDVTKQVGTKTILQDVINRIQVDRSES